MRCGWRTLVPALAAALLFGGWPQNLAASQDAPSLEQALQQAPRRPPYTQQTPEQLQQLVAPIALYPDSLVAQILAASTFPEQVVEADRWIQAHPDLKGDALAQAVDQQPWDPSVKALTAFPSVLGNMDKNLSWTSSLGDAYYNEEQDVMDAVQVMRRRAQDAGNLQSTPQQTVKTEGSDIEIEPVSPEIIYVPAYDPWIVYGGPIVAWPGWYPYPGIWYDGPFLFYGAGFGIGFFGGYGWGWHNWGFDWHDHYAIYNHDRYYSHSRTFYNRGEYHRSEGGRGGDFNRGEYHRSEGGRGGDFNRGGNRDGRGPEPSGGNREAARGYAEPRGQTGTRSGAFSGYGHGGEEKNYSSRGSASFGGGDVHGGGGFHGGGGGFHGGGGRH
jgi:uncharacterized membrane protein YgcG